MVFGLQLWENARVVTESYTITSVLANSSSNVGSVALTCTWIAVLLFRLSCFNLQVSLGNTACDGTTVERDPFGPGSPSLGLKRHVDCVDAGARLDCGGGSDPSVARTNFDGKMIFCTNKVSFV